MKHGIGLGLGPGQNRIVRPNNYKDVYTYPRIELRRLAANGIITKVATGYYVIPPDTARNIQWQPSIEAVGAGIALATYPLDQVAIVGVSAARILGALPRAVAAATIAVPKQRPRLTTRYGDVIFRKLDVGVLELRRVDTEIVTTLVTTPTQTVLDIAFAPTAGDTTPATATETIRNLAHQCDWVTMQHLARAQRKTTGLHRALWVAADVTEVPDIPRPHERVKSADLQGSENFAEQFGVKIND